MSVSRIALSAEGPQVSKMVYGAWRLGDVPSEANSARIQEKIRACLDVGITTFDHADIYGGYACEGLFGEAFEQTGVRREDVQFVSKCGIKLVSPARPEHRVKHYDTSAKHVIASVEGSLRALRTDRLELLLLHRPDPLTDADEVARAFTRLREQGKVLHFGVSNYLPHHFELLASRLPFPLVTNQIELSLVNLSPFHDGTLDQCQRLRISPMAWSPLGGGSLFRSANERAARVLSALEAVRNEIGGEVTVEQVALAWLFRHPSKVVPVLGTGNVDRIRKAAAAEQIRLTTEQWFALYSASLGHNVP